MTRHKTFFRWWAGVVMVLLAGFALWWFNRSATPAAAPKATEVTQSPSSTLVPPPREVPIPTKASAAASPSESPGTLPATTSTASAGPVSPVAASTAVSPAATAAVPQSAAPAPAVAAENPAEIAATARMYAAHASLRTPEVSDPDSKANKQILQAMVTKAFMRNKSVAEAGTGEDLPAHTK